MEVVGAFCPWAEDVADIASVNACVGLVGGGGSAALNTAGVTIVVLLLLCVGVLWWVPLVGGGVRDAANGLDRQWVSAGR